MRNAQLAEQVEGSDRRLLTVELHDDGRVLINAHESGEQVRNFWGSDHYEYWVSVPADELGKLAFHLLRERYAGAPDAVERLRAFCEQNGIGHHFEEWY